MIESIFLVDTHCHLHMLDLTPEHGDLSKVLQRAKEYGVQHILNVSVSIQEFNTVLALAENYPFVTASVGLHPNEQSEDIDLSTLVKLSQHHKVIAIGETGLDYFRSTGDLTWQQDRFRVHIAAAKQVKKPIIVHTRAAREDTIKIMQAENAGDVGGIMHCFSEDWATAKQALDMGFYISFSGVVTFKNAAEVQAVARQVPLDRILIETDAPYLAPMPHRGKPNEPAYLRHTAEYIANLRNVSLAEFAQQTTDNFYRLFKGLVKPHV